MRRGQGRSKGEQRERGRYGFALFRGHQLATGRMAGWRPSLGRPLLDHIKRIYG